MLDKVKRDESGRFKKGTTSPNPGGRGNSKGIVAYIKLISNDLNDYIDILHNIVIDKKSKNSDKMCCIRELLDRSLGKPQQFISDENSLDIKIGLPDDAD